MKENNTLLVIGVVFKYQENCIFKSNCKGLNIVTKATATQVERKKKPFSLKPSHLFFELAWARVFWKTYNLFARNVTYGGEFYDVIIYERYVKF